MQIFFQLYGHPFVALFYGFRHIFLAAEMGGGRGPKGEGEQGKGVAKRA